MKKLFCCFCCTLLVTVVLSNNCFSKSDLLINRIEGVVYDPNRIPINDIRIELQNEVGSLLTVTKTSSGGRFTFAGVSSGHFTVKALPSGLNFLEETRDVEVVNLTRFSSDIAYVDIYLRYDKRAGSESVQNRPAEAIFVQEIPKSARKLYETGIEDLKKDHDKGTSEIDQALKIFPNYFDALSSLGSEYNSRKEYEKAYPYFLRAIDVNPRSSTAFYSLAYAFYQLNQIPAALKASRATIILAPDYVDPQLLYGTLLRLDGNYKDAETALLKAKSLAKTPNSEVHWQLALLYNRLGRNKEAADELEIYLKLNPNSPDKNKVQDLIIKLRGSKQKGS